MVVLFGFIVLFFYGGTMYGYLSSFMRWVFSPEVFSHFNTSQANVGHFFLYVFYYVARIVFPLFAVLVTIGLFFNFVQVGIKLSAGAMQPSLDKLNPISGFKRIFSMRSVQELFKNIIKITVVGTVGYFHVRSAMVDFIKLHDIPLMAGLAFLGQSIFILVIKISIFLIILAIIDWIYQKYEFEKSIKMTKQEVKDEMKQREGDPLVRSRIRSKQREIAFQRMMAEVPKADVVITNPIHLAVALTYVAEEMHAPKVVAKGAGVIADRIKEIAKENDVPILEDRNLAQSLFKAADVGDYVPPNLFKAVAEVLAYVYRLGQKQHQFGI